VLAAALKVADAEGLPAVTMRRVGASLGVEAMSLYHHLPGKDGLVDGLVETVVAEIEDEVARRPPNDGWREDLWTRCLAARRVMLRHPWAPGLIGSRSAIPAAAYAYFEAILATLIGGGFTYHLAHRALHSLGSMALGFAAEVFTPGGPMDDEAAEEDLARMAEALPHLVAMAAAELHDAADPMLGWCDGQAEFEFTLGLLLDGLDRARART
jgi:AcrR family transcriptional regulator